MNRKQPHTLPGSIITGFFLIGLISAIAFRSIIVFQRLEPAWVRPVWYIGVMGYMGFFFYRYAITKKRKHAIRDYELIEKIRVNASLTKDDRDVVIYLLSSVKKSHEDINYLVIFVLSIIAVLIDLFFVMYG
jgi:hypothetical protein